MRVIGVLALAWLAASAAEAQYGLYGAPEVLQMAQQTPPAPVAGEPSLPDPSQAAPRPGVAPQVRQEAIPAPTPPKYDFINGGDSCNGAACAATEGCGTELCGPCGGPWYGSLTGLIMGRSDGRRVWTSYKTGEDTYQLTNSQFNLPWQCGGEAQIGRRFCCNGVPWAIEASYWSGENFYGTLYTRVEGGQVSTPLDFNSLYLGSNPAAPWFDSAQEHRLVRSDEYNDFEINFIRQQFACGCDSPWDIGWSFGVRYFRFQDFLQFSSLSRDATSWEDAANIGYVSDRITNNLIGIQGGVDLFYRVCNNVRLFVSPQIGVYDNYMDATFAAYTGDGVNAHGPYGDYPVHTTYNGLAFLTQIDLGVDWQFARNWGLRAGYRIVAVTGVGLADDQFPQYICDSLELRDIQHFSSLVLQGAFLGITYNF